MAVIFIRVLLLGTVIVPIIFMIVKERSFKFWLSNRSPWNKIWRVSFWGMFLVSFLSIVIGGVVEDFHDYSNGAIVNWNVVIVGSILLISIFTAILTFLWVSLWSNRVDWWDIEWWKKAKHWQKILFFSSLSSIIIFFVIMLILP